MRYEEYNLGDGMKAHEVYDMPTLHEHDYWTSVTDVPCPVPRCTGTVRWAENGGVPGSRICDGCGRYFQAKGSIKAGITLMRDKRFDSRPAKG